MSKALILAVLFVGLPAAAYADEGGGGAIGAIVRAPGEAAAGIVGGLTGAEAPRFHHYIVEENVPSYTWAEHPRVVVGDVLPAEGVILSSGSARIRRDALTSTRSSTIRQCWSIRRRAG